MKKEQLVEDILFSINPIPCIHRKDMFKNNTRTNIGDVCCFLDPESTDLNNLYTLPSPQECTYFKEEVHKCPNYCTDEIF